MATWISTAIDLINAGASVYGQVQGGSSTGRGTSTVPTPGTPAPSGMFDPPSMTMTDTVAAAPIMAGLMTGARAIVPRVMTSLGALTRSAAARRLLALTKTVGIQAAAAALGMGLADALGLLGESVGRRRRRRGISARDLRVTRRTTRRLIRAAQDLSTLSSCVKVKRRSPCS